MMANVLTMGSSLTSPAPMPYSTPGPAMPSQGHPGHRRSHSNIGFVTGGAYTPMAPPRRKTVSTPRFHLKSDDDDSSHSDDDAPVMKAAAPDSVPFPRTSPLSSPQQAKVPFPLTTSSPRPSFSRTSSTPILLSNGKPLKSSLKSSSSSPNIPFPPQSLVPSMMHHARAASAPTTPHLPSPPSSPTHSSSGSNSHSPSPSSPQTPFAQPKYVHFPSQEEGGLATVRLFKRSARPAALSKPEGEETETETEGEGSAAAAGGWRSSYGRAYPFPRIDTPSPLGKLGGGKTKLSFEIDPTLSSNVPSFPSSGLGNIHLESLSFSSDTMNLSGTLLVRNLAYEKVVAVRFTLDEWDTTSEVLAKYAASLPSFSPLSSPANGSKMTLGDVLGTTNTEGWDRFGFAIRLEDYAHNLSERTMWLVVRYVTEGGGEGKEWWDNNGGGNYRVAFRERERGAGERKRQVALSAPPAFPLPPKLSSSSSLPPSWTVSSSSSSTYPSTTTFPSLSPTSTPMSQAKAQTTLTRLKKLNLRNYAAPGTVGAAAAAAVVAHVSPSPSPNTNTKEDPPSASEGPSSLTTTPLTSPLHTPVGEHALPLPLVHGHGKGECKEGKGEGCGEEEGCLPASFSRFSGREREEEGLAISPREGGLNLGRGMGMDIVAGFPATVISGPQIGRGSGARGGGGGEMGIGVSPPFSSFAFMGGNGGNENGMYWSWGSANKAPPVAAANKSPLTSPTTPKSSSPTPATPKASSPTPTTAPILPITTTTSSPPGAARKTTLPALLLDNIRKKSTHSPPRSPVILRKEGESPFTLRREGEKAPPTFLLEGGSSSSSGSSGSDADAKKGGVQEVLEEDDEDEEGVSVKVKVPIPMLMYTPPTPRKASTTPQSPTTTTQQKTPSPSPSSSSDEVYQAFVRQWCFAQGPPADLGVGGGEKKGGVVG